MSIFFTSWVLLYYLLVSCIIFAYSHFRCVTEIMSGCLFFFLIWLFSHEWYAKSYSLGMQLMEPRSGAEYGFRHEGARKIIIVWETQHKNIVPKVELIWLYCNMCLVIYKKTTFLPVAYQQDWGWNYHLQRLLVRWICIFCNVWARSNGLENHMLGWEKTNMFLLYPFSSYILFQTLNKE